MTACWLREAQGQNTKMQTKLVALVGSRTYRAGEALRDGGGSIRLIAMPLRLARVMRSRPDLDPRPSVCRNPRPCRRWHCRCGLIRLSPPLPRLRPPVPRPSRPRCSGRTMSRRARWICPRGAPGVEALLAAPRRNLRIAAMTTGFTLTCYAPEAEIQELTAGNWRQEIGDFRPDFLFVESAWRGKNDSWDRKIGHRSQELHDLVAWCRQNEVPTVFWNKEIRSITRPSSARPSF